MLRVYRDGLLAYRFELVLAFAQVSNQNPEPLDALAVFDGFRQRRHLALEFQRSRSTVGEIVVRLLHLGRSRRKQHIANAELHAAYGGFGLGGILGDGLLPRGSVT